MYFQNVPWRSKRQIQARINRTSHRPENATHAWTNKEKEAAIWARNRFRIPDFFMPSDSNESPDVRDYFIFRNRAREQHKPIFYQSLFTISKDMETWGIRDYAVLDETRHEGLEDVFNGVKEYLSKRRESIKPIQQFLDTLASQSRNKTK